MKKDLKEKYLKSKSMIEKFKERTIYGGNGVEFPLYVNASLPQFLYLLLVFVYFYKTTELAWLQFNFLQFLLIQVVILPFGFFHFAR